MKYLKTIGKNDILISDMYLNESHIRKILNKHMQIENKLHISYGGKLNNTIWKTRSIVEKYHEIHARNF